MLLVPCSCFSLELLSQGTGVERARQAEGPRERPAAYGEIEAQRVGVQVRAPARSPPSDVWGDTPVDDHEAEELGPARPSPAAHAGALRACRDWLAGRRQVYPSEAAARPTSGSGAAGAGSSAAATGAASERMSMRHPVSRAARRAF